MTIELVPIKINIGIDGNTGHAKYPAFNNIDNDVRKGLDWSIFVDKFGSGWHYDKTSGHKEHSVDSPIGQQWGILCVPEDFALQATTLFPNDVFVITESEVETFYNEKAHAHEPVENVDIDVLHAIKAKKDLGIDTPEEAAAIDRNHPARGIRFNKTKTWAGFKEKTDISIKK